MAACFIAGCNSMSKDTRIIATQGLRLVPMDYELIGDTAAEETRIYILGFDFAHLFTDELATYIEEDKTGSFSSLFSATESTAKRGALYKALEKVPQADRLLEPRWTVQINDYIVYKKVNVKVNAKAISYTKSSNVAK
jgi:hypothetical protein